MANGACGNGSRVKSVGSQFYHNLHYLTPLLLRKTQDHLPRRFVSYTPTYLFLLQFCSRHILIIKVLFCRKFLSLEYNELDESTAAVGYQVYTTKKFRFGTAPNNTVLHNHRARAKINCTCSPTVAFGAKMRSSFGLRLTIILCSES